MTPPYNDPTPWPFEWREAFVLDLEHQLNDVLDRITRLSRNLAHDTALVDYLQRRIAQHKRDEDAIPF